MKKLIPLILMLLLTLTSCFSTPNLTVTSKNTDSPTITMSKDGKAMFYYQGFVELNVAGADGISKIKLKDVKIAENKNGIPTLHKGGAKYFDPNDIKNIQGELDAIRKADSYMYDTADVAHKDKTSIVKLQYLILDVPTDVKKEDIKRKVTMKLECQNAKGKKIAETPVEITIP